MIAKIHHSPEPKYLYRVIHRPTPMDYFEIPQNAVILFTDDLKEAISIFEDRLRLYTWPDCGKLLIERAYMNIIEPKFEVERTFRWLHKDNIWTREMIYVK
jgi:hypothetical protein